MRNGHGSCQDIHMTDPNWRNRTLFHGDNLDFLRGMNSESVHLIATDPPFNKGRDFHATPDSLAAGARFQDRWSWKDDVEGDWIDQIQDDWPAVWEVIDAARAAWGDDMAAFLCFMGVRLIEMRRVLRDDGSLYLHCDPTASHYLKVLLDAVFGRRNFQNEIVWCYSVGGKSRKRWGRKHDIILFYSKSASFKFDGDAVRIDMKSGRESFGGRLETDEDGRQYRLVYGTKNSKGETRYYKYYLDKGKIPEDWWTGINSLQSGTKERTGYPTQKPLALYERIIAASSSPGDIVLDPFAGCATTPITAERLGRQWVAMDIWDGALDIVRRRLEDNRQLLANADPQIHYVALSPTRTDNGEEAAPFLQVTERYAEPGGPKMSRAEMYDYLLAQHGQKCQGCDRTFDDPRYLELDHNTPRSDGGMNHITNRVLLCGPCNRLKSNQYTLSGLRRQNQRQGYMASG